MVTAAGRRVHRRSRGEFHAEQDPDVHRGEDVVQHVERGGGLLAALDGAVEHGLQLPGPFVAQAVTCLPAQPVLLAGTGAGEGDGEAHECQAVGTGDLAGDVGRVGVQVAGEASGVGHG